MVPRNSGHDNINDKGNNNRDNGSNHTTPFGTTMASATAAAATTQPQLPRQQAQSTARSFSRKLKHITNTITPYFEPQTRCTMTITATAIGKGSCNRNYHDPLLPPAPVTYQVSTSAIVRGFLARRRYAKYKESVVLLQVGCCFCNGSFLGILSGAFRSGSSLWNTFGL